MWIKNFFAHLHTINKHRFYVMKYAFKLGLIYQGLTHDLSKYSPTEFFRGVKYYQGRRSPNDYERELNGYSIAWIHHKGRNKHHFEYWNDLNLKEHQYQSVIMPIKYVKEMLCDRLAASKTYLKRNYTNRSALEYFESKNAKTLMHPKTAELIYEWLKLIAKKGEKEAFKIIKKQKAYK